VKRGMRDVMQLMTGTAAGQAIGFLAAPLLSRLYTPDDFGVVGVFLSVATVLGVVAALRLELAVVVPKADEDAQHVMAAAMLVVAGVVIGTTLAVLFAGAAASRALGAPALVQLLGILPFYVGSLGTFQVFNYWSTRVGKFGRLASAQVTRGVVGAAGQIGSGAAHLGAPGMLAGQVAGQVAGTLVLLGRSARAGRLDLRAPVSFARSGKVLREYADFIVYGAPQSLLNAIGQGLPAIVLTATFGAGAAGQYLLARRVVTAPSNLLGQSLRQVIYPHLSRQIDRQAVLPFVVKATLALFAIAAVPAALLAVFGPRAFAWGLGDQWRIGGEFARYLGLNLIGGLMNIPAVSLVPLLRIQRWHAVYEAIYTLARVGALVGGGMVAGPVGAVAGMAFVGIAFNVFLIIAVVARLKARLASRAAQE